MNETELKAEIARLNAALAAKDTAELERSLASTKASLEKSLADKAELEKALAVTREQVKAELDRVVAEKAALEKSLATAQEQLTRFAEERVVATRVSQVVAALKWDEDKARKSVDALKGISDAAFAAHLEILATAMTPVTNNPQSGNTTFHSGLQVAVTQPVTGLGVNQPVTGLGDSRKPVVASVDTGVLDRAQPQPSAALAAADAANQTLSQDILQYLGATEPNANTQK